MPSALDAVTHVPAAARPTVVPAGSRWRGGRAVGAVVVGLGLLAPLAACTSDGTVDTDAVRQLVQDASEQTQQITSDVHRLSGQLGSMKSKGTAALTQAQEAGDEARKALDDAQKSTSTLSASARHRLDDAYQDLEDARARLETLKSELPDASQARATIDDVEKQLDSLATSVTKTVG
jgi:chromosome segregation ATPase